MMTTHNKQGTLFPDDDGVDEKSFADITALEAELDRLVSGLYGLAVPETGGAG